MYTPHAPYRGVQSEYKYLYTPTISPPTFDPSIHPSHPKHTRYMKQNMQMWLREDVLTLPRCSIRANGDSNICTVDSEALASPWLSLPALKWSTQCKDATQSQHWCKDVRLEYWWHGIYWMCGKNANVTDVMGNDDRTVSRQLDTIVLYSK